VWTFVLDVTCFCSAMLACLLFHDDKGKRVDKDKREHHLFRIHNSLRIGVVHYSQ